MRNYLSKKFLGILFSLSGLTLGLSWSLPAASQTENTTTTIPTTIPAPAQNCINTQTSFQNGLLILNSQNNSAASQSSASSLFLLHNLSKGVIAFDHQRPNGNAGAGAGWTSKIDPGNFSLIAMHQKNFALKCMIYNPPVEYGTADCQQVVSVCKMLPKKPIGSFWVSENKSLLNTLKTLEKRGF